MSIKIKSRTRPGATVTYDEIDIQNGTTTAVYTETLVGDTEEIIYETGPKKRKVQLNGRRVNMANIKYCRHTKVDNEHKTWSGYASGNFGLTAGKMYPQLQTSYAYCDIATLPPISESLEDFIKHSFNAMYPKFKLETNLLNFIYELREIKTLIPSVKNIRLALERLLSFRGLDRSSKVYSEAVLNLNYGINPLISDLEKLYSGLANYNSLLEDFKARAGTLQKRNYTIKYDLASTKSAERKYAYGETYWSTRDCKVCKRSATLYYYYNIVNMPPKAELFTKYLGLRSGALPAAFWNALPFSFLIDYVVKIGDWLEQLDLGAIDIEFIPLSYSHSLKLEDVLTLNMKGGHGTSGDSRGAGLSYRKLTTKLYERTRVDDLSILSLYVDRMPAIDSFDSREQMLTFNLINALRK